jgi:hypothetical protein
VNPDVAEAIDRLESAGLLAPAPARLFARVARGDLLSLYAELRALLYAGVLLTMSGVGLLLKNNLDRIGPVAIAAALGLAAAGCFGWTARHAPPFSWGEEPSPNLALDYILLLGVLLTGADLAYVEAKFTPLGPAWAWHLLMVSVLTAALALRFDSRVVFSLALSSFAAWRGVSVASLESARWSSGEAGLRVNAVGCGLLFLLLGASLSRTGRKAHFEPVATHLAWILILGTGVSGLGYLGSGGLAWALGLFLAGAGLAVVAFARGRFSLFVMGVLGGYIGLSALFLRSGPDATLGLGWFVLTSAGMLVGLLMAHQRMKKPA